MRISDWSSDVCSSDLAARQPAFPVDDGQPGILRRALFRCHRRLAGDRQSAVAMGALTRLIPAALLLVATPARPADVDRWRPLIQAASTRFGIPTSWLERVIRAETRGLTVPHGPPIHRRAGAMGLMQRMLETELRIPSCRTRVCSIVV